MRRGLRWGLVLAGLVVLVGAGVVVRPRAQRITRENFDHVHKGMTQPEVEAILGPPGDHRSRLGETIGGGDEQQWQADYEEYNPVIATWHDAGNSLVGGRLDRAVWIGDELGIVVVVDDMGRVVRTDAKERRTTGQALDNLLWRLKRQWRRWFPEK